MPDLATNLGPGHITASHTARIVAPATTAELSEVLRACNSDGLTVVPIGGRTKLGWGNPVHADVLLSTERLAGVREHAWADLTATAGAGTPWASLEAHLAQHKQRVALDPLFPSRATVGGVLATNDSGSLRARYGSLRDLVLGMTIVLADGTVARTGGKVVKNVAGYDLPKLLTGSFGTLGIITEATFRLHPLPVASQDVTLRGPDALALGELMKQLYAAHLSIERCQLRFEPQGNEPSQFALDLELSSVPEALAEHLAKLRELAAGFAFEHTDHGVWQARESLFSDPRPTVFKVTTLPARLPALMAGFAGLAQFPGVAAQCIAEPSGVAIGSLVSLPEAPLSEGQSPHISSLIDDLRSRLRTHGGSAVVLQRGHLPTSVDTWGGIPSAIDVMRAVKAEFDPHRTLSPGRFVGGI